MLTPAAHWNQHELAALCCSVEGFFYPRRSSTPIPFFRGKSCKPRGVESLRAHDAQAFRSLIDRLQQPIIGYLHRLVSDREVALDLAQDTFVQVYTEIEKTSGEVALDAWIYRIATNYGLRYLKRKRLRHFVRLEDRESFDERLAVAGPEEQTEISTLIQQALAALKPVDAAILQLHFGNGFTDEEFGAVLHMSSEAVRKRVARSVEKFRRVYSKNGANRALKPPASS